MAKIDLDTLGSDDGDWEFGPENPPEQWTIEKFRRLSIGDIRRLQKPDNGILSSESQKSFDEVSAAWTKDFNARLRPALASLVPKIDISVVPKIELPLTSLGPINESIRKSRRILADQIDISKSLGVTLPEVEWKPPASPDLGSSVHEAIIDMSRTSAAELEQQTSTEADHLAALESIREVLVKQGEVLVKQDRAAARGAFFYILVGLTTALAGVATIVTMSTWRERWLTIGITVGLGLAAWAVYARVKAREKPHKTVEKQASQ